MYNKRVIIISPLALIIFAGIAAAWTYTTPPLFDCAANGTCYFGNIKINETTIIADFLKGDGSNLTNLPAGQLTGTAPLSAIPATLTGKDADTVDGYHQNQDTRTSATPLFAGVNTSSLNATNLTENLNASNKNITVAQKISSKLFEVLDSSLVTIASYVDSYSCGGSYCIYQPWYDSGNVYAKNMSTGVVDFKGNFSHSIANAIRADNRDIYIYPGTYTFTGLSINQTSNTKIRSSGKGSVVIYTADDVDQSVFQNDDQENGNRNITIDGIAIEGNRDNNKGDGTVGQSSGIEWIKVSNSVIRNTYINGSDGAGIFVQTSSTNNIFEDLDLRYNGNETTTSGSGMFLGSNCKDNFLSNIYSFNNSDLGIDLNRARENTLVNIHTDYNGNTGLGLYGARNNTITGLISNSNSNHGLKLDESSNGQPSQWNVITGAHMKGNGYNGIRIEDNSSYNTISEFELIDSGQQGILTQTSSHNNTYQNGYLINGSAASASASMSFGDAGYNRVFNIKQVGAVDNKLYAETAGGNNVVEFIQGDATGTTFISTTRHLYYNGTCYNSSTTTGHCI